MFLISTPVEGCAEDNWLKLENVARDYAIFSNIAIPSFHTAPTDELYELARDMQFLDRSVENLFRSFLSSFESALLFENIDLLEGLIIKKQKCGENITNFSWNMAIYSPYMLLSDLADLLYQHYQNLDQQIRHNVAAYRENLKVARECIRTEDTLATQNLACFVREENVIDTEYIQSVYVAVPLKSESMWYEVCETLHDNMVACSSCLVAEDRDYKLYSVVIVREDFLEFRDNCAKYGFIARVYQCDPNGFARKFHERQKVEETAHYQNIMLIQWLKIVADEIFEVLMHVKIFRAYIASSIVYGGREFQIIMFHPRRNLSQRLQTALTKLYEEDEIEQESDVITDESDILDSSNLSDSEMYLALDSDSEILLKPKSFYPPYLIYKVYLPFPQC
uniref:V-type proton ATPase subunit C n=1 Tax=Elaeophora elaphi TaxID=1147741 RepID=A0A0R3S5S4_9BILA